MESDVLPPRKRIALVAHDNRKDELLDWARENKDKLRQHELYGTGTTGWLMEQELGIEVTRFQSGPLGGDQQLGARISERGIDVLVFFWDLGLLAVTSVTDQWAQYAVAGPNSLGPRLVMLVVIR